jgi:hypothetical protein
LGFGVEGHGCGPGFRIEDLGFRTQGKELREMAVEKVMGDG